MKFTAGQVSIICLKAEVKRIFETSFDFYCEQPDNYFWNPLDFAGIGI